MHGSDPLDGVDSKTQRLTQPSSQAQHDSAPSLDTPVGSTTYPILELPTEIMTEIFVHCLPSQASAPRIDTAPLLLGRICSTWRTIVLATPALWCVLKIARSDIPVELIETWLARAQNRPLSLVVDCFQSDGRFVDVLKRHSHTWCDVELGLPFEQFYLFGPDLPLPMLRRLAIGAVDYQPPMDAPVTAFRSALALRHLRLLASVLPGDIALPWEQLTCFESDALSSDECLTILKYTPNIAECVFGIYFTALAGLPDVPPLVSLTSLCISSHLREVTDILEHISTPALQVLELKRIGIAPLHRFLAKSGCRLRELTVRIQEPDESLVKDITEFLETQPGLEKLALRSVLPEVLTAVVRQLGDGSAFLPCVCSLAAFVHVAAPLQIHRAFTTMLDTLADTLAARWGSPAGGSQIRTCTITYSSASHRELDSVVDAFRPRLETLAELGIEIYVGT
ncbi:hypothetical protein FB451DRAFT_1098473 [Mycena latifolia]|nr:hypothetical protein FB451DRAFT_1098473 [Mycena latifolia]